MSRHRRLHPSLLTALVLAGCVSGNGTRMVERRDRVARDDPGAALAYDDAMLEHRKALRPEERARLRADRADQFARLLAREIAALGPLDAQTAAAHFATYVVFRREAERVPGDRREDLEDVVDDTVRPGLDAASSLLWDEVEALYAEGRVGLALRRGAAVVAELPPGGQEEARLAALRAQAGARHVALAEAATGEQFGARLLHARLAAFFGVKPGDVSEAARSLRRELEPSYTVETRGTCGDFARQLASDFTAGDGQPVALVVEVAACRTSPRAWQTQERARYTVDVPEVQKKFIGKTTKQVCSGSVSTSIATTSTTHHQNTISTRHSTMDTGNQATGCKYVQEDEFLETTVMVPKERFEEYVVSHRAHDARVTGTVHYTFEGKTTAMPFDVTGQDADRQWRSEHAGDASFGRNTDALAKDAAYAKLKAQVTAQATRLLAQRGRHFEHVAARQPPPADPLEVDHLHLLGFELRPDHTKVIEVFAEWMQSRYGLDEPSLVAALNADPPPPLDLTAGRSVPLPPVPAAELAEEQSYDRRDEFESQSTRGARLLTAVLGPTQLRRPAASGGDLLGGHFSFALVGVAPDAPDAVLATGFGFRLNTGADQTLNGYLDMDLMLLGGLSLGGFSLAPLLGLGFNFTGSSIDGPQRGQFNLPASAYFQYGARLAYAFDVLPLTIEVLVSKAYRASDELPVETRADLRIGWILPGGFPLGITARYADHLDTRDSVFAFFDPTHRAAERLWLLGGVGF